MPIAFALLAFATLVAWPAVRRWGSRGFLVPAAAVAGSFVSVLSLAPAVIGRGEALTVSIPWIPSLGVSLSFRMDALAWLVSLVVTGVGALVLVYCSAYFSDDEPALPRFAALLTGFAAVMFGLVASDDIVVMFMFWEITSVLSYLLIGHTSDRRESRGAALQALLVTTFGGLVMLIGVAMLVVDNGTTSLAQIVADPVITSHTSWAVVLVIVGALSKSAIVPFHFWLPSAMAAPTPVSAYLHAAAMVKAGIYLVLRLAPGYAGVPGWLETLLPLGVATLLVGAWRALRQFDLKLLLAYGTVSQLGLMITVAAVGTHNAMVAALGLLVAHALFKATLFMVVGVIDHNLGTRDWRALSGLGRSAPWLATVGVLSAASMAGLPPLLGFIAKEGALSALLEAPTWLATPVVVGVVVGSALTFGYSWRFAWGAFATRRADPRRTHTASIPTLVDCTSPHARGNAGLTAPTVLLAISLVLAFWVTPLDVVVQAAAAVLPQPEHPAHLALWHGFTPALALTAVVIAGGVLLALNRRRVARLQQAVPNWIDLSRCYTWALTATDWVSARVTLFAQRGGLPGYLATIFWSLVIALGYAATRAFVWPAHWVIADSWGQLAIAALMAVAGLLAVRASRRMAAVLLVGVTGYGMVALFALHGAPDLALTQLLVETISVVIFVLVLRRLPRHFERAQGIVRVWPRVLLAVCVGVVMAAVALVAVSARTATPISERFPELAYLEAHGRNIVNVLLVDIRAWDTMGEISVLVVVATGVASLVFITQRTGRAPTISGSRRHRHGTARLTPVIEPITAAIPVIRTEADGSTTSDLAPDTLDAESTRRSWLMAGRALSPHHRSLMVEVVVRLIFWPIMLVSVWLLIAGHNQPGGGFAGGLVAGLALVLRYLAAGRYELGEALPIDAGRLLGAGLAMAVGTGVLSMLFGEPMLTSLWWEGELPLFGELALGTPTLFDIGVYLVVLGLVLDILRSLGAGVDEQAADDSSIVDDWAGDRS